MPTGDRLWRGPYEAARRYVRHATGAVRRQPWLALGALAATAIVVVLIASHGAATPSAPVQSLTGQTLWGGHRTRSPGNLPVQMTPAVPEPASTQTMTGQEPPSAPAATTPPALPSTAPQQGLWPVSGKVTQGYGWVYQPSGGYWYYNTTWQIAAAAGTPVHSAFAGIVQDIEHDPTQGLTVSVLSGGGVRTEYGGLSSAQVKIGQQIAAGAVIGQLAPAPAGQTGQPHLYFAIRQGNQPIDPGTYLQAAAH